MRANRTINPKRAFTMLELIFVIVVIGILVAIAIPRLAAGREDACQITLRNQYNAVQSGARALLTARLRQSGSEEINLNFNSNAQELALTTASPLFGNVLPRAIVQSNNTSCGFRFSATAGNTQTYFAVINAGKKTRTFSYNRATGRFIPPSCSTGSVGEKVACRMIFGDGVK